MEPKSEIDGVEAVGYKAKIGIASPNTQLSQNTRMPENFFYINFN
jgi:hypothetical protein